MGGLQNMLTKRNDRKNNRGFTLIEIMIVLAIVGLLFSLVGVKVIDKWKDSQKQAAKLQISAFQQTLQAYYLAHSAYPHTSQGLQALISKPTVGKVPENYPDGGHFGKKVLPKDPWGHEYIYECEDYQTYSLSSAGPDGEPGTADDVKGD
jgi:general secretion pathway protein G